MDCFSPCTKEETAVMCWKMRAMNLDNCQGEASNSLAVPLFLSDFSNLTFPCLFVCERILLYIAQADSGLLIIWTQCWDYRYGLPCLKITPSLSVFVLFPGEIVTNSAGEFLNRSFYLCIYGICISSR